LKIIYSGGFVKKGCLIAIIILLIIAIGITIFFYVNIKIPPGKSNENILFEVKEGEGTIDISDRLKSEGFIRSSWIFSYYVKLKNVTLYPGMYYLRKNMTLDEIISPLAKNEIEEYKITIPEGWNVTQIADYLAEREIINRDDFIAAAKDYEGYLFPDTYRIPVNITAKELVSKMVDNFNERTKDYKPTKDDVILASIIEREAKRDEDRAKIAGVYVNRLNNDMYLGADPTIQYAKGNWNPITLTDLKIDSPYNTYTNKGLPPTPICNPGLKSIKAAVNPEKNNYLYFFNITDGSAIFSADANEHELNKEKYKDQIAS
jgi:UPF0755 protein